MDMQVISEIDQFLAFLGSPLRSHKKRFIAYRLEDFGEFSHQGEISQVRTLFYGVSITGNDFLEFEINDGIPQASKRYTLCFISPFHLVSFRQKTPLQGLSFQFAESFIRNANGNPRFYEDFPFFGSNNNSFVIGEPDYRLLSQLGERIVDEYKTPGFSEDIIRDYLHLFLLEARRIIDDKELVENNTADYLLFRRFYILVNTANPVIRTVENAAHALSVTPAHLWLIIKRLSGQTPSAIINERVLREAKRLLLHADLNVREVSLCLKFRVNSHFTRFFKNLTGLAPSEYIRQAHLEIDNRKE